MDESAKLNSCDPPITSLSSSFVCHSIGDIETKEKGGRGALIWSNQDSESMILNDTNSVFVVAQLLGWLYWVWYSCFGW